MISFFRKIRKSLVGTGSTTRYLTYAVGEIFLVMLGILLALQVNNWNQERINSKDEDRIFVAIAEEANKYRWQIRRGLSDYNSVLAAADRLVAAINDDNLGIPMDTIEQDLSELTTRWLMGQSNSSNIYDALAGAGELGLIKSQEMRKLLGMLKRDIKLLASYESLQTNFVDNHLNPYLNQHLDGVKLMKIRNLVRKKRYAFDPAAYDLSIEESNFQTDFEEILSSQYFSNLLLEHMTHTATLIPIYLRMKGHISLIDSIIIEKDPQLLEYQ